MWGNHCRMWSCVTTAVVVCDSCLGSERQDVMSRTLLHIMSCLFWSSGFSLHVASLVLSFSPAFSPMALAEMRPAQWVTLRNI